MSSPDCNPADVIGCVRNKPNLAFGIFSNSGFLIGFIWMLFLSYQGILRFTDADGIGDLMTFLWYGISGPLSGISSIGSSLPGREVQMKSVSGGWVGLLIYLAALITVVALGAYWKDSPIMGTFALALILASALVVFSTDSPGAMEVVGGVIMGLFIVGIVWLLNFFTLEKDNEFGNTVMLVVIAWLAISFLALYGSRKAPKRKKKVAKKTKEAAGTRENTGQIVARQDKKYPLAKLAAQFEKKYKQLSREKTGANATDSATITAWKRAVPLVKEDYDNYGSVDMDDIVAFVYRD